MDRNDDLKLLTILLRSADSVKEVLKKDVKSYDLNITEFGTLEYLYHKGASPIHVIGSKLLMAKSSMSYVVEKLKEKKYIFAIHDLNDLRIQNIDLTQFGRETIQTAFLCHQKTIETLFNVLSSDEKHIIKEGLKKIGYFAKGYQK